MSTDRVPSPPFSIYNHVQEGTTHTIFLALGANVGNRWDNLANAIYHLRKVVDLEMVSSVYETEPVGYTNQPRFLNIVLQGQTQLTAEELLANVKEIETLLGRKSSVRNGPRLIDIDILFYDKLTLTLDHLIIPHPRLYERAFVLVPLAEIAPGAVDPKSGKTVKELLAKISQEGVQQLVWPLPAPFSTEHSPG